MRLIDAEEAKEILKHLLYETAMNNSGGASLICEDIAEYRLDTWVGLIPTVDAEPVRHGHWVLAGYMGQGTRISKCSICGSQTPDDGNYCSNCGARMDAR